MNEFVEPDPKEVRQGCVILVLLVCLLGYCTFGENDKPDDEVETSASFSKPTILGQSLIDAASGNGNASDFVKYHINSSGHRCAQLLEIVEVSPAQYGVGCILNRDGSGRANYLIDSRLGGVSQI